MSAGFVVADVRTLDKQQGSYRQVTAAQRRQAGPGHLGLQARRRLRAALPVPGRHRRRRLGLRPRAPAPPARAAVAADGRLEVLAERQAYLLFDRMVAFHIQRGLDGAPGRGRVLRRPAPALRRARRHVLPALTGRRIRPAAACRRTSVEQLPLFVTDEKSAILWLRARSLGEQPQTYQDLQPRFLRELHQARHEELPELRDILEENFLQDDAGRWYVPDPAHAEDLEKLRERSLLREFRELRRGPRPAQESSAARRCAPASAMPGAAATTRSSSPWPSAYLTAATGTPQRVALNGCLDSPTVRPSR